MILIFNLILLGTFKYVLPRFSNCSEDSEVIYLLTIRNFVLSCRPFIIYITIRVFQGYVLIAGSSVHGSKSNLKTAAKREGSHIESLEAAIYEGTVNKYRHSDSIKKVKTENSG
ncbi:unnamed protein product [Brassica rapa subsp. trilocularis]